MTPITWQAAVNNEEQQPLLQDILEAAIDDRRQVAVDVEEQRPQLQDIFEAASGLTYTDTIKTHQSRGKRLTRVLLKNGC